jgi:hypothetical protein
LPSKGPLTAGAALKVKLAVPLLVRVMVCALLVLPTACAANVTGADKLTVGAVPVPLKVTVCVLPAAPLLLSVMVSEPERAPAAVGVKVTLIVQLPPAATLEPHVFV